MKRIVAFVSDADRKEFEEFEGLDIHFASSIDDFEANLTEDCIPVLTLLSATAVFDKSYNIIKSHEAVMFYFLTEASRLATMEDMDLLFEKNTETEAKEPSWIAKLAMRNR